MKKLKIFLSLMITLVLLLTPIFSYAETFEEKTNQLTNSIQSDAVLIMEESTRKSYI